ncbi:zinc-binding dehydrogenase [Streptomyces alkaliphilus]|uniref:Zinc-binding dehydrogenase n=1 Tax=Streptomyces alkaliphilus TaxID=1472722 RepID=A0A7W3Y376_9ACTN|nr:NADP-dependent oxidoreductase [Streptomyces alkaliphilus]MBB0246100.1 zinc-binding dehydrogenase [Streptomyces alkaliphilus]
MKAIALHRYGGPDELREEELPEPRVAPGEVLIRVRAAGVNPVDWKIGAGALDALMEVRFPLVPGWDVSGVVESVGLDVREFEPGDEVLGYLRKDWTQAGTYAELVSAHVRLITHKPPSLGWAEAAGLPLAGLTALQSLRRARVGSGDTVLVHAAAGGVGSLGTQLAVLRGARVIGTASPRNHDFLRGLGAEPVEYGDELEERVRALAPRGVDAALDFVGENTRDVSASLVHDTARIVSIADPGVSEVGGSYLWVRPDAEDLAELARLAAEDRLTVPVEHTLPLSSAAEAWRRSAAGRTRGKIVLTVS